MTWLIITFLLKFVPLKYTQRGRLRLLLDCSLVVIDLFNVSLFSNANEQAASEEVNGWREKVSSCFCSQTI